MNRIVVLMVSFAVVAVTVGWGMAEKPAAKNSDLGKMRHVVLFKFKDGTPAEKIKAIESGFRALPTKISEIVGFDWGANVSPEGKSDGFTHCFLVTFNDAKGRDAYLPHPAHQEFVKIVRPHVDKVLVVDYVAQN